MHIRILIITLVLLVTAFAVPAQDEATVDDESADSEQPSEQAATAGTGEIEAQETATPTTVLESDSEKPGLDSFTPSEEISADRSVAFPNDI